MGNKIPHQQFYPLMQEGVYLLHKYLIFQIINFYEHVHLNNKD